MIMVMCATCTIRFDIYNVHLGSTVRLANGITAYDGRVEIHHKGVWFAVCRTEWDFEDANVACRQLGFAKAEYASFDSKGVSNVWPNHLHCSGKENSLQECPFTSLQNYPCFDFAAVTCGKVM